MNKASQHHKPNASISFLPERVNRRPSVYKGMTFAEIILVILTGVGVGTILGIFVMLLFRIDWYAIPMGMFICGWSSTRIGGVYISRLKRGKPETWFDRYIELKKSPSQFITQHQHWSIRRSKNFHRQ